MKREKEIEDKLVSELRKIGCLALKYVPMHTVGMPDRLVLIPGGVAVWVELKAPGEKPRLIQDYRLSQLRELGFRCFVVDSYEGVQEVVEYAKSILIC